LTFRAWFSTVKLMTEQRRSPGVPAPTASLNHLRDTLTQLFREPYISAREYFPLMGVGRTLQGLGYRDLAMYVFSELAGRIEYVRQLLLEPRLRVSFDTAVDELFERMVAIYLDSATDEGLMRALIAHEANRARAVRDLIGPASAVSEPTQAAGGYEAAQARLESLRR